MHAVYGDAVLLDVREPAIAAALVRLGADVDARARGDGETLLIRAARIRSVELVRVLLAAHASVYAETMDGATALSEAIRGGHDEVAALLREAGAGTEAVPVERPSTGATAFERGIQQATYSLPLVSSRPPLLI
jgi:ankyrin repeat protein